MSELLDEGCGGRITVLPDGWVRKTVKRAARHYRNSAAIQFQLQTWCAKHLTPENGYKHLFSPETRPAPEHVPKSYEQRSVVTQGVWPWILADLAEFLEQPPLKLYREEVAAFAAAFEAGTGYKLYDTEFFVQPDGRVAVLDFDQCRKL
jgi:transglutaminase-like putative cysteine protease